MLQINKEDVLLEDEIKIFDKDFKIEIVLEPTTEELKEDDDPVEWSTKTIKAMTIADNEFYKMIEQYKLQTTVLNYLITQLQKKENS